MIEHNKFLNASTINKIHPWKRYKKIAIFPNQFENTQIHILFIGNSLGGVCCQTQRSSSLANQGRSFTFPCLLQSRCLGVHWLGDLCVHLLFSEIIEQTEAIKWHAHKLQAKNVLNTQPTPRPKNIYKYIIFSTEPDKIMLNY